jgi:hypothetical protein
MNDGDDLKEISTYTIDDAVRCIDDLSSGRVSQFGYHAA